MPAGSNDNASDPASARIPGSYSEKRKGFAHRAMAGASGLRSRVHEHIQQSPYDAVGIACVVGLGVGVVFSSRIVRGVLAAALTAAGVELARGFVRQTLLRVTAT